MYSVPQRRHRDGRRAVEEKVQFQWVWCCEDASAAMAHVSFTTFYDITI